MQGPLQGRSVAAASGTGGMTLVHNRESSSLSDFFLVAVSAGKRHRKIYFVLADNVDSFSSLGSIPLPSSHLLSG